MKVVISFLVFNFAAIFTYAQPASFSYQAVVRDAFGNIIDHQAVGVRASILESNILGTTVFQETHSVQTNEFGMLALSIGQGNSIIGNLGSIDWGATNYFLKIEMDENAANNYILVSFTQLVSVPYALCAEKAKTDGDWEIDGGSVYRIGDVGIGTNNPQAKLEVDGSVKINGGTPAEGKVLMSDDEGLARWQKLETSTQYVGINPMNALTLEEENLFATLDLNGSGSGNVMQGFAFDNRNKHIYTSHRYNDNPEYTIINKFTLNGTGEPTNVGNSNALQVGHPQDLSIEYLENEIKLWTSSESGRGVSRITYNGNSSSAVSYELLPAHYSNSTPTVSNNGRYLVVRAADSGNPTTNDRIFVYLLEDVLNGDTTAVSQFVLHPNQMVSNQWFQGIVCDDDIVYCLTGDSEINNNKLLYAYTFKGEIVFNKELTTGRTDAQVTGLGSHWEPEGMSLYQPNHSTKALLIGIVSGLSGFRVKRVYSIGLGRGIVTVNGDYHPYDVALHFSGGSKDISYEPSHALQFGQWDGSNWTEIMRLNSSGNVGIGTSSIDEKLHVAGKVKATSFVTSSDLRFKQDITQLTNVLTDLQKVKGVYFHWKTGDYPRENFSEEKQIGMIAQELEAIYPELVHTDGDGYKTVDYSKLTAVLVEAVKALKNANTRLRSQVEVNQFEIAQIKSMLRLNE